MNFVNDSLKFGTRQCKEFRGNFFRKHYVIAEKLAFGFLQFAKDGTIDGNAKGNRWLRDVDSRLRVGLRRMSAASDDDDVKLYCSMAARECEKKYVFFAARKGFDEAVEVLKRKVEVEGLEWPAKYAENDTAAMIRDKDAGAVARVSDSAWWRRAFRKKCGRIVEKEMIDLCLVNKRRSAYLSDWAFTRWKSAQVRNRGTLQNMIAVADDGTELDLIQCMDASVSNPVNRRNELMTRMRGYEELADERGLVGALFTLTAPSKYHAMHAKGGKNTKYKNFSPSDTQRYLCRVWSRIRTGWSRAGIGVFGFRVCEPHHDGTPHFHVLLFFLPGEVDEAKEIFASYALEEDGDEDGAKKHRWSCVEIDKNRGSATGYIAKYISKNIDGFGFGNGEVDEEAEIDAYEGSLRARAWASLWGIRQFQQIGATPVTVYRELRRVQESAASFDPDEVVRARQAADAGDWKQFVNAMGGPLAKRKEQLLKPVYKNKDKQGKYGEAIKRILGVGLVNFLPGYKPEFCMSYCINTHLKEWEIKMKWAHRPPDILNSAGFAA